jgi:hypothetical protein
MAFLHTQLPVYHKAGKPLKVLQASQRPGGVAGGGTPPQRAQSALLIALEFATGKLQGYIWKLSPIYDSGKIFNDPFGRIFRDISMPGHIIGFPGPRL